MKEEKINFLMISILLKSPNHEGPRKNVELTLPFFHLKFRPFLCITQCCYGLQKFEKCKNNLQYSLNPMISSFNAFCIIKSTIPSFKNPTIHKYIMYGRVGGLKSGRKAMIASCFTKVYLIKSTSPITHWASSLSIPLSLHLIVTTVQSSTSYWVSLLVPGCTGISATSNVNWCHRDGRFPGTLYLTQTSWPSRRSNHRYSN